MKRADVRVQPPGLLEEQAALRRHRRVARRGGARAPTGRRRAGALPWSGWSSCCGSPSRTRSRRGRRDRDDVGERHLARLVDEQHVDRRRHLVARPEPRRAADDVHLAARRGAARHRRCRRDTCAGVRRTCLLRSPASGRSGRSTPARRAPPAATLSSRLPMTLWLLAVTPTRLPGGHQVDDHLAPRACVLPGPGGPWMARQSPSSVPDGRRAASPIELSPLAASGSPAAWPSRGGSPQEQLARRRGSGPAPSMPCSATHSPIRSRLVLLRVGVPTSGHGTSDVGSQVALTSGLLQVDVPAAVVERDDRARAIVARGRVGDRLACPRRCRAPAPGSGSGGRSTCRRPDRRRDRTRARRSAQARRSAPRRCSSSQQVEVVATSTDFSSRRCQLEQLAPAASAPCCSGGPLARGPPARRRSGAP